MKIGTALIRHSQASAVLVEAALLTALHNAQIDPRQDAVSGVLLFLSEAFAPLIPAALQTAMHTTSSTNISGALCAGLLNEHGWVMDSPAAAAMVFSGAHMHLAKPDDAHCLMLVGAPHALNTHWLNQGSQLRFGSLTNDVQFWHAGRQRAASDAPLALAFDPFELCGFDNTVPMPEQLDGPPRFGFLFPKIDMVLSDVHALDRQLSQLRNSYPGLPLLGLFDPGAAGHVLPFPNQSGSPQDSAQIRHHISADHNLLVFAHLRTDRRAHHV
ncbi:MAG: hypothetical protein EPO06_06765 [Burkholderiaceae bacterium]|nr:MAG: hypothetical protein EPO06_06765 [Burkholderiaceae bacterium]